MCIKVFPALALTGTLLASGVVVEGATNSANARDYYTRKRIDGVWVTGHFEWKRPAPPKNDRAAVSGGASTSAGLAPEVDHPPPLQRAVEVRRAATAAALADPIAQPSDFVPLRLALEARAKIMAQAAAGSAMKVRRVRSMTLDFENRIRTIQFVDGTLSEEPLDPIATGGLSATAIPSDLDCSSGFAGAVQGG